MSTAYPEHETPALSLDCPSCGEVKPIEAFSIDRSRRSGRHAYCRACKKRLREASVGKGRPRLTACRRGHEFTDKNTYHTKQGTRQCRTCRSENAMRRRRETKGDYQLRWTYGISADDYDAILTAQDGCCFACGERSTTSRLTVDHDHATGVVRGLLCGSCNLALGKLQDSPEILRRLADYLESPPAAAVLTGERKPPAGRRVRTPQPAAVAPYVPQPRRYGRLTDKQIEAIRARVAAGTHGTYTALAKEYGVCQRTVRDIVKGRTWGDVP